jgi:superfamily II RNA helicase
MRDFTSDLRELSQRITEAQSYLRIEQTRARVSELEIEVSRPDLWDDQEAAKKATDVYESVLACCTTRAARTDFINAALAAGKTDHEIYLMLLPAVECRTYYETTAIFKILCL